MNLDAHNLTVDKTWNNRLYRANVKAKAWMFIAIASMLTTGTLLVSYSSLSSEMEKSVKNARIILTPAVQREIIVESGEVVSHAFAKAFIQDVVENLENWNYVSVKDNYERLFNLYYDNKQKSTTQTNLLSTSYFEKIIENKMSSFIDIDWGKSKIAYCEKMQRICGLVVGSRNLFTNESRPFSTREVAYLILAKAVRPDPQISPMALRVTRVSIYDSGTDNYKEAKRDLDLAEAGEIKE